MTVSLDEFCDFPRLFDTFKSQKLHEFYGQDETHIIYESVKLKKFIIFMNNHTWTKSQWKRNNFQTFRTVADSLSRSKTSLFS